MIQVTAKKQSLKKIVIRCLMIALISYMLAGFIFQFGATISVVQGGSMSPTLMDGDLLLINKFRFWNDVPQNGDVITFEDPKRKGHYLVKRVVGVPGDEIHIKNGMLFRNGNKLDEQYTHALIEDGDFGPVQVKSGTVFVLGDNRYQFASRDSRFQSIGLIPFELIEGKVELILWRNLVIYHSWPRENYYNYV